MRQKRQRAGLLHRAWQAVIAASVGLMLAVGSGQAAVPGVPIADPGLARRAALFEEPLVPTAPTGADEDGALLAAIARYQGAIESDDFTALEQFAAGHPESGWQLAVLTNLGLSYSRHGYVSRALDAFRRAWISGQSATEPHAKALADRAVGELLRLHARLGHTEQLAALLHEVDGRGLSGPATELRAEGRETLWLMRTDPGRAFRCGPTALKELLRAAGVPEEKTRFLDRYRPGPQGTSLAELGQLATEAGLTHHLVHRTADQSVPVPSVVHWTTNHFATLLSQRDGRYEVADPAAGRRHLWVTRAALDAETSGFFLAPGDAAAGPWRQASAEEATQIRGSGGPTSQSDPTDTKTTDRSTGGDHNGCGMCGYSFTEMLVSLRLADTPVGYAPPIGPSVRMTITYNQREASQPANFAYFNVSPKWSLNWLAYIVDDPNAIGVGAGGGDVTLAAAGGGSVNYTFNTATNSFAPEIDTGAVLSIVNPSFDPHVPRVYKRVFPDGTVETYSVSNNATTALRNIFLSSITDPAGNSVTLNYDATFRLTSIVDATGRSTKFSYGLAATPLLVTDITDPFGRAAHLKYDASGRLHQIIDVLGLTSQFDYDASSLVNKLTTPYGATNFAYADGDSQENGRYVMATDPLGNSEYLQYNQSVPVTPFDSKAPNGFFSLEELEYYNTCYWDKHAYKIAAGDCTRAHITHWTEANSGGAGYVTANTIGSTKQPLESRLWFNYPGQGAGFVAGQLNKPTYIARILDDGTTQATLLSYNGLANPTQVTDPVGRTTTLQYAPNQIDVLSVQQATASGPVTTAGFTYNAQHLPLTYTDAAGQTTSYAYYPSGQIKSVTNALGQATTYYYDGFANLSSVVNANGRTAASFTYDAYDRVASYTDSEGWTISYLYDALDRVTQETYPDGTTRVYTYQILDPKTYTDRQGRKTTYVYDAVRNLHGIIDPQGQTTNMAYYENGALKTLTDPDGHVTTWAIDLQSRVTGKTYADGKTFANAYEATTSRLHAVTDPLGQTKQYSYLADDRLAGIQYLHAVNTTPSVSFAYDPSFPRLTAMADGTGTTTYAYNPPGALGALRLAVESPPFANSAITYAYDALGRVVGRSVGGDAEAVTYDAIGRVISHASDLGIFQRGYLGQTAQLAIQRSGNIGTHWFYDSNLNDRRLTAIANSPVASRFQYATTPENDISAITESLHNQTWSYTYDLADRLKTAASSLGAANGYSYGYDAASNLGTIQRPSGTTTVAPNSLNQVSSAGGVAFSYDANGNLLSDASRTYQWDADNRLIGIGYPGTRGSVSGFSYDGLGRRIAIASTSGGSTGVAHYGWCGEMLCQARDANDTVTRRYIAEGEASLSDGSMLYYSTDHLGSVRDVIALPNGLKTNHYDYEPYGSPTTSLGSRLTWTDFRYAGLFYHQQSGLYLATYRAYDPIMGRWLSQDPIKEAGGINLYAYVLNDPLDGVDPLGWDCNLSASNLVAAAQRNAANTSSTRNCARTVRQDFDQASQGSGLNYVPRLGASGTPTFGTVGKALVASGCYLQAPPSYPGNPGDVAVTEAAKTGHVSIDIGPGSSNWASDYVSPRANPGGPSYVGSTTRIYQYIGPP